ncbi:MULTISPECIES: tetratricopeptide repeat protein [Okeania]|nr:MULTISPECIES: tetratricopeptide repeat protein [Okeania]NES78731.1 tetratricopeptide repeat protein [Okeania sp. SIO1H4]NET12822.1 tetratricopeptide repeat protein [Okeania sp. SIO1H6]NET23211.1 tetratricopeptide repeat protein [Okeania sp. SIO1H5]NET96974.1 tetratricopeptide repeat protein [Okeania sp. SIO1H2]
MILFIYNSYLIAISTVTENYVLETDTNYHKIIKKIFTSFISLSFLHFRYSINSVIRYFLLLIPGIIYRVNNQFYWLAFILRKKRDKTALFYSRLLVSSNFWKVFFLIYLLPIFFGIAYSILSSRIYEILYSISSNISLENVFLASLFSEILGILNLFFCLLFYLSIMIIGDTAQILLFLNRDFLLNLDLQKNLQRAVINNRQGNFQQAIANYTKAVELNPYYPIAYNNRANIYSHIEKYEQALADYNKAIQLNPNNFKAYINKGLVYYKQGKYEQALVQYDRGIEINPNYAFAYYNKGLVDQQKGNKQQAIKHFLKAGNLYKQQKNKVFYQKTLNQLRKLRKN